MKIIKKLLGVFVFICIFMFSARNVSAKTVEVSNVDDFLKYVQRRESQAEKVTEIKLVDDITISDYAGIMVEDGLTIDLNGKTLDINEALFVIMYGIDYGATTLYDYGTLTFKDSSIDKSGTVDNIKTLILFNGGKDSFDFNLINQNN